VCKARWSAGAVSAYALKVTVSWRSELGASGNCENVQVRCSKDGSHSLGLTRMDASSRLPIDIRRPSFKRCSFAFRPNGSSNS